jgi:hypothetical protein
MHGIVNRQRGLLVAAPALAVVATVLYAPVLSCYFVDDDFQWLAAGLWFDPGVLYRLDRLEHFYRPATQLYFWIAANVLGPSPFALHALNLMLHAGNSMLVLLLGQRIGDIRVGLLAALFFVVQPRSFEAVGWVSGVAHLICTGAYLATVLLHSNRGEGSPARRTAVIGTFLTALLANETGVTLLPMLIVWDACFSRDLPRHSLVKRYAPFVVMLGVYLAIETVATSRNYLVTEGHYRLGWHVVPNLLTYVSWMWVGRRDAWSLTAIAAGLLLLIWRGSPAARLSASWLVVTLVPVSFFTWELSARYTYLPSVGLSLLIGLLFARLLDWARLPRWRTIASAAVAMLVVTAAARSAVYARQGITDFCERTRIYERYVDLVRRSRPDVGEGRVVVVPPRPVEMPERFLRPLIETVYRTPVAGVEETIR